MDSRLDKLETDLVFMERKVEELSTVIYSQQLQLDAMKKQLELMEQERKHEGEEIINKRPPHY